MTKISDSFANLLLEADDSEKSGIERADLLFNVYKKSFREYKNYHILDAQFNIIFDRNYPDTPYLDKYFDANKRVLNIFISIFKEGFKDKTIKIPYGTGQLDPLKAAYMFLNVINSYVEKISLRKTLMEEEQGISMEEELRDFIQYLIESLKA